VSILEAQIADMNASLVELQSLLNTLNVSYLNILDRVETLENKTGLPAPDYDSFIEYEGWRYLPTGPTRFDHNLGTTNVLVYVIGTKTYGGTAHQIEYGGEKEVSLGVHGAYWHELTTTEITVHRNGDDGNWEYVRVMIWKLPPP